MEGLCESVKGEWSGDIDLHVLFTNLQQENQSLENDSEFLAASMWVYVFCHMGACVRLFMSVRVLLYNQ